MNQSPSLLFRDSLKEVSQLLDIHARLTGTGPGRRHQVEVLNKSAVLFTCAAFEAFIESMAEQAFTALVSSATDHNALPKPILRSVANQLREDKNELRIWDLAGTGWKQACDTYRTAILGKHTGPFNTPKPHNIDALFKDLIGLPELSKCWQWPRMRNDAAIAKLKSFVELRGALAHGAQPAPSVTKRDVVRYVAFLAPLSVRSANRVRDYCHQATGAYPWPLVRFRSVS
jgi:RiboL-PSP-HEPN